MWDYRTITPLERPKELGTKEFFTAEEAAKYEAAENTRQNRYNANVLGTKKLLELCRKYAVKQVMIHSTYFVYGASAYNPALLVHGQQSVTLHRPLPVEGSAVVTSRVVAIWDKGKAAVPVMAAEARKVGVFGILRKPVDVEQIENRLRELIKK